MFSYLFTYLLSNEMYRAHNVGEKLANVGLKLQRFRDTADFLLKTASPPTPIPANIGAFFLG